MATVTINYLTALNTSLASEAFPLWESGTAGYTLSYLDPYVLARHFDTTGTEDQQQRKIPYGRIFSIVGP